MSSFIPGPYPITCTDRFNFNDVPQTVIGVAGGEGVSLAAVLILHHLGLGAGHDAGGVCAASGSEGVG